MAVLDEIRAVRNRLISDEDQIADLEFAEAQANFCEAACRWADNKQPSAMDKMTECEVKLLNAFFRGENNPTILKAWAAYRRRLLFHHRRES
jgi:hypothetical protein